MNAPVVFLTGDSTIARVYGVNRTNKTFVAITVVDYLPTSTKPYAPIHIIADVELLSTNFQGVLLVGSFHAGAVCLLIIDNVNALSLLAKGGTDKEPVYSYEGHSDVLGTTKNAHQGMYARTYHNETGDMITSESMDFITNRGEWGVQTGRPESRWGQFYTVFGHGR